MAISKLALIPDNSSYSVQDGKEVISVALDGGASRYRHDILGATSRVSVLWICDRDEYKYLRSFYRALVEKGALPFLIDLVLDDPLPTEHRAHFIPGSLSLTQQRGLSYYVSAELEVEPTEMDLSSEADFAAIYSIFGKDWKTVFPAFEEQLDTLINIEIPTDLYGNIL